MVTSLELSYTFITVCSMIHAILYIIFSRIWGRIADSSGWTLTAMYSIGVLGISHIMWVFAFPGSISLILIPLGHVLGGIAWSGINISLFNIPFDYIPSEGRTLYLGFNAAFSGIVGYGAALVSSTFVGVLDGWAVYIVGMPVSIIQLIFLSSGVIILLASFYVRWMYKWRSKRAGMDVER